MLSRLLYIQYIAIAMSRKQQPHTCFFFCLLISIAPLSLPLVHSEIDNHPWRWWKTLIAVTIFSYCEKKIPVRHRCQFSVIFWNAILLNGRRGGRFNGKWKMLLALSCSITEDLNVYHCRTQAATLGRSRYRLVNL